MRPPPIIIALVGVSVVAAYFPFIACMAWANNMPQHRAFRLAAFCALTFIMFTWGLPDAPNAHPITLFLPLFVGMAIHVATNDNPSDHWGD
jgi:hypothetical protein